MFKRLIASIVSLTFLFSNFQYAGAQDFRINQLPVPGSMIGVTPAFVPLILKGMVIHPENALKFDFLMDTGHSNLKGNDLSGEGLKIMKYFLTALTIPEDDLWVNLSPYEKGRIVQDNFGQTIMGRDLLAEDYVLKQLTASLIYPEKTLGKEFWQEVYSKAAKEFGTTQIPVNTFNKVWIVPSQAVVWEHDDKVLIVKSHLKVMLEEDYLSLTKHVGVLSSTNVSVGDSGTTHSIASKIVRQIVLPVLEKEVNEGKNFAQLRQMYQAMILATWYKKALKESILNKVYADQKKTKGVDGINAGDVESIYQQYLKAFKKGAFNYIKEDIDSSTGQMIQRKYFSGGFSMGTPAMISKGTTFSKTVLTILTGGLLTLSLFNQRAIAQASQPSTPTAQILKFEAKISEARTPSILDIRISKLINQLISGDFDQSASQALIHIGKPAVPALVAALTESSGNGVSQGVDNKEAISGPLVQICVLHQHDHALKQTLLNLFKSKDPDIVQAVSDSLENVGDDNFTLLNLDPDIFQTAIIYGKTEDASGLGSFDFSELLFGRSSLSRGTVEAYTHKLSNKTVGQYLRLTYLLGSETSYDPGLEDDELSALANSATFTRIAGRPFNDPEVKSLIESMNSWDENSFNNYLPRIDQFYTQAGSTWAAGSYSNIIVAFKTAALANRSVRVRKAIKDGLIPLPSTVSADFQYSGAPSIIIHVPKVYYQGQLLNSNQQAMSGRILTRNSARRSSANAAMATAKAWAKLEGNVEEGTKRLINGLSSENIGVIQSARAYLQNLLRDQYSLWGNRDTGEFLRTRGLYSELIREELVDLGYKFYTSQRPQVSAPQATNAQKSKQAQHLTIGSLAKIAVIKYQSRRGQIVKVITKLNDNDRGVRHVAMEALDRLLSGISRKEKVSIFLEISQNSRWNHRLDVYIWAAQGLVKEGYESSFFTLKWIMDIKYRPAYIKTIAAFVQLGDPGARDILFPLLGDPDRNIRLDVENALVDLGASDQQMLQGYATASLSDNEEVSGEARARFIALTQLLKRGGSIQSIEPRSQGNVPSVESLINMAHRLSQTAAMSSQQRSLVLAANVPNKAMTSDVVQWLGQHELTLGEIGFGIITVYFASMVFNEWWKKNTIDGNIRSVRFGDAYSEEGGWVASLEFLIRSKSPKATKFVSDYLRDPRNFNNENNLTVIANVYDTFTQNSQLSYNFRAELSYIRAFREKNRGDQTNSVMQTPFENSDLGGITLNAKLLDMQIKRDGNGVPLPVSQQPLDKINIQGFVPQIISIQPVNLSALLGL